MKVLVGPADIAEDIDQCINYNMYMYTLGHLLLLVIE